MSEAENKELNFEDALKQLEQNVMKMERGELSLDDNIKCFEEGTKLVKFCSAQLNKAEKKVEILLGKGQDGQAQWQDFGQQ
ncbi:MAG: exodeoxyribonuclease VII small subunit [Lentisphaeraceae bacterium]|nr:exodeoxyribonuclease VII small subunit [Lentisphaeraceae bacterium]